MVTARPLNKRSTTILIAAALAVGTGFLLFNYLNSVSHVAHTIAMRTVVVATHDIPARTVISPSMLTTTSRPADAVDPDVASDPATLIGQLTVIDIPPGSTLSSSKVVQAAAGGLTVHIPPGERAISIALDRVKGVSDLVSAGDHVDVIAVTDAHGNGIPHAATILRNKVVLAMGTSIVQPGAVASPAADGSSQPPPNIETATLAVTPTEAKLLALADLNATLRLSLRSQKEANRIEAPDAFVLSAPAAQHAVAAAPAGPPAPHTADAPHRTGITMIDGDKVTQ
jgi:pilus assembly protein CpaB